MAFQDSQPSLNRFGVEAAHQKIKNHVHKTPVLTSHLINEHATRCLQGVHDSVQQHSISLNSGKQLELYFKCENFQKIGAFKFRGAFYNVMSLDDDIAVKGVCTHSSGNHAQALALAARIRGIPAYIVMPEISTSSKISATKAYGAEVHFSGSTSVEREVVLERLRVSTGATFIPPYDYLGTILGQGTTGLELEQQVHDLLSTEKKSEDLDAVVTPLGGGGLLSGVAIALASQIWNGHKALIYGAEPSHDGADDARRGLISDPPRRIQHVSSLTIADGLRTPVGELNWSIISDKSMVANVYAVTDAQIKLALRVLFERLKVWVEPSAAVPLAVVLFSKEFHDECKERMALYDRDTWRIGLVLSGGNTTVEAISSLFRPAAEANAL